VVSVGLPGWGVSVGLGAACFVLVLGLVVFVSLE